MRPIERKVLKKINEKDLTLEKIEEIIYNTPKTEMKKSYPDDSHFQSDKYFAKLIVKSLLRYGYIIKEGNFYKKNTSK